MKQLVNVGDFCPNKACAEYGKLQDEQSNQNIKKHGFTAGGVQRFRCNNCGQTFTETKGTLFYRKRTEAEAILEVLAFLAEGTRISTLSRVKGHKEDTILEWLREAAEHVQEVEAVLLADYQINRGQLDAMWSYVGHKGEKKDTLRQPSKESSGEQR